VCPTYQSKPVSHHYDFLRQRAFDSRKHVHSGTKPVNLTSKAISDIFDRSQPLNNVLFQPNGEKCKPHWIIGTCKPNHPIHAYPVFCGKPNCPTCGKPGSQAHRKRFMNVLKHLPLDNSEWRYWVFPITKSNQALMHDPKKLQCLKKYLTRCLKDRFGTKTCFNAWHFMGDMSNDFFVHLNSVTPGGYVNPVDLEWVKEKFAWWLRHKGGCKHLNHAVVNVEFLSDIAKKCHILYYITRPTLWFMTQDRWAVYRKMRVVSYSGDWRGNPDEDAYETMSDSQAADLLANGKYEELAESRRCVACGKVLHLTFRSKNYINIDDFLELIHDTVFIKYVRYDSCDNHNHNQERGP
jgi:hypothetical protein